MEKTFQYIALTGIFIYAIFASTSITIVQGGIILALLGWTGKCVLSRRVLFPDSPLNIPVLLFVVLSFLVAFLGLNVLNSLDDLRAYTFILFLFLIPTMVPKHFLKPLVWCFIVFAGVGGSIYFFLRGSAVSFVWQAAGVKELFRMGAPFAVALALVVHETGWKKKALLLAVAAPPLFLTITGLKRGPWLGIAAAMFVVSFLRSRKVFVLIIIVIAVATTFSPVRQRVLRTVNQLEQGDRYSRFQIWAVAPEIISQYPYGLGSDNRGKMLDLKLGYNPSHFHSNFVTIAVELGVLGLVAWCWWMLVFAKLAYDTWRSLPPEKSFEKGVCLAGLAGLASFLAIGICDFNFEDGDAESAMMLYFLMGCVVAVNRQNLCPVSCRAE